MRSAGQKGEGLPILLAGALALWGLEGRVRLELAGEDRAMLRAEDGVTVAVTAQADPRARWRVRVARPARAQRAADARTTRHAGVPGMLRTVRAALAPEQRAGRMIVAPAPSAE